jgi:uncharacterized protein DUF6247
MRAVERQFSEFLRDPNDVVAALAKSDVLLRRRGAPTLRLSQASRDELRDAIHGAMARVLRNLAEHNRPAFREALVEGFPWVTLLPEADRTSFVRELTDSLLASEDLQNFVPVGQVIREWRNTAEIHADPELAKSLREPIERVHGKQAKPPKG